MINKSPKSVFIVHAHFEKVFIVHTYNRALFLLKLQTQASSAGFSSDLLRNF